MFVLATDRKSKEPEKIRLLSSLRYECYKVSSDELKSVIALCVPKPFHRNLYAIFKSMVAVRSSNGSPKALDVGRIFYPQKFTCHVETQIANPTAPKCMHVFRFFPLGISHRENTSRKPSRIGRWPKREAQQKNEQCRDRPQTALRIQALVGVVQRWVPEPQ